MGKGEDDPGRFSGATLPRPRAGPPRIALVPLVVVVSTVEMAGLAMGHSAGSANPTAWNMLNYIILAMAFVIAAVVYGLMFVGIRRYREDSQYVRTEPKLDDRRLEFIWTGIPFILVIVIVLLSMQVLVESEDIPEDSIHIQVIGRQYEWEFVYPDNTTSIGELWIEEGQHVAFDITSEDVVHSFFLPQFYLKVDAFPGQVEEAGIHAEPVGDYDVACAEFCGDAHHEMLGTLHIFEKGLGGKPYGPPPGHTPPPPAVERVNVTLEIRDSPGPSPAVPWTISQESLTVSQGTEITLTVVNNATQVLNFSVDAPYSRSARSIPPGQSADINLTADKPTSATRMYPWNVSGERGMEAVLVVEAAPSPGVNLSSDSYSHTWLYTLIAFSALVTLVVGAYSILGRGRTTDDVTGVDGTTEGGDRG